MCLRGRCFYKNSALGTPLSVEVLHMKEMSEDHLGNDATVNELNELRIWHKLYQVSGNEVPFPVTHSVRLNSAKIGRSQAGYESKTWKRQLSTPRVKRSTPVETRIINFTHRYSYYSKAVALKQSSV